MAIVLPFRRRPRALVATTEVTSVDLPPHSGQRMPARLLDDTNVEAAATWLNRAYAVLEKAPDWWQLDPAGKVIRLRGLIDDEAHRIGIDRMTDRGWLRVVEEFGKYRGRVR